MRFSIYKMLNLLQWDMDPALFLKNERDGAVVLKTTGESAAGAEESGPVLYDPFNDYIDLLAAGIERHFRVSTGANILG